MVGGVYRFGFSGAEDVPCLSYLVLWELCKQVPRGGLPSPQVRWVPRGPAAVPRGCRRLLLAAEEMPAKQSRAAAEGPSERAQGPPASRLWVQGQPGRLDSGCLRSAVAAEWECGVAGCLVRGTADRCLPRLQAESSMCGEPCAKASDPQPLIHIENTRRPAL